MRHINIFLLVLVITHSIFSQEKEEHWVVDPENDFFLQPNCPLTDGYTDFLLRQKLELNAYQTILQGEYNLNQNCVNKIRFTTFLPFIAEGNFESMIGTRYNKSDAIINQNDLNMTIQYIWFWTAWQYKFDKLLLTYSTESYLIGNETSLHNKTGNRFFTVFYTAYEFNPMWSLYLLTAYDIKQLEDKSEKKLLIGLQGRYQPSKKFKILFGAPTLFACEWTMLPKTDFGFKYSVSDETLVFVRQRLSNFISISCQYNSNFNKSDETYFGSVLLNPEIDDQTIYNNLTLFQHQLFTEISFNLYEDIGFNIGFGYNFENKVEFYNNHSLVSDDYISKDNLFINCTLQFLRLR